MLEKYGGNGVVFAFVLTLSESKKGAGGCKQSFHNPISAGRLLPSKLSFLRIQDTNYLGIAHWD